MPSKVLKMTAMVLLGFQEVCCFHFNNIFPPLRLYCTYQDSRKNWWISLILGRVLAKNLKNKGLHFVVILRTYLLYLSNSSLYLLR